MDAEIDNMMDTYVMMVLNKTSMWWMQEKADQHYRFQCKKLPQEYAQYVLHYVTFNKAVVNDIRLSYPLDSCSMFANDRMVNYVMIASV